MNTLSGCIKTKENYEFVSTGKISEIRTDLDFEVEAELANIKSSNYSYVSQLSQPEKTVESSLSTRFFSWRQHYMCLEEIF